MITFTEVPDTNIVEFTIEGEVTKEDFDRVVPQFVAAAKKHSSLRLLKQVLNLESINPESFSTQLGEIFTHLGEITHVAMVADSKWESPVRVMSTIYPFQVKFFQTSHLDAAREWLRSVE